ncbi:hypothetical protein L1887_34944 [Cichorium endivia]|nr:hypothetical protein L1887_34944 [Cichorium endivia]
MAVQLASSRPLDPMASPYNKMPPPDHHIYELPRFATYYHFFPPVIAHSRVYSYNVHLQPAHVKSLPLSLTPPPSPEKKTKNSLAPVPSGPRIPKSRLPGRRRRVNKVVRFGNNGGGANEMKQQWKPVVSKATTEKQAVCGGKKRWKNRSGGYQQVLHLDTTTTSVMIKNIPNKYTRKLMIQTLDNHCKLENKKIKNDSIDEKNVFSAYDFLYLPIDFKNRVNAGFAFVNFTTPEAALRFKDAFHGKHWDLFGSPKIAEITRARIQGKRSLINNCKTMDFTYGSEEDMPVSFEPARDGSDSAISKMMILGKFLH